MAAAGRTASSVQAFLIDARDAVETLRDGTGWEVEYPRDVWRLHTLPGITTPRQAAPSAAQLRFDRITQPWLRTLAKRWARLRLTSGLASAPCTSTWSAHPLQRVPRTIAPASTPSPISTVRCWNATSPG